METKAINDKWAMQLSPDDISLEERLNASGKSRDFLEYALSELSRTSSANLKLSESELTELSKFFENFKAACNDYLHVKATPRAIAEHHEKLDSYIKRIAKIESELKELDPNDFGVAIEALENAQYEIWKRAFPKRHEKAIRRWPTEKDIMEHSFIEIGKAMIEFKGAKEKNAEAAFNYKFLIPANKLLASRRHSFWLFGFIYKKVFEPKDSGDTTYYADKLKERVRKIH